MRRQVVTDASQITNASVPITTRVFRRQSNLAITRCLPRTQTTASITISWTSQSCLHIRGAPSSIQNWLTRSCPGLLKRTKSPTLAAQPPTGKQACSKLMKLRCRRLFQLPKDPFGAITVKPIPQSAATSRLSSRNQWEHMGTTHVTSCQHSRSLRVTKTMSLLLEQQRPRPTSQDTMASFLRQTSTQVLSIRPQLYLPETPSSSKTSSRTTEWKCQVTQVTFLRTVSTSAVNIGQTASTQLESSSTEGMASRLQSSLDLVFWKI